MVNFFQPRIQMESESPSPSPSPSHSSDRSSAAQMQNVKINPPNLDTLPPEIVIMMIRIIDFEMGGDIENERRSRDLCGYSRICSSFKIAQESAWSTLVFKSEEKVLDWLESDATIRGDYKTINLILNGNITQATIEELFAVMNQGEYSEQLSFLSLEFHNILPPLSITFHPHSHSAPSQSNPPHPFPSSSSSSSSALLHQSLHDNNY